MRLFSVIILLCIIAQTVSAQPAAKDPAFYKKEVYPILKERCLSCHSGATPMGDFKLTSREYVLKGGASGSSVDLKNPPESLLLKAINFQGRNMPPGIKTIVGRQ